MSTISRKPSSKAVFSSGSGHRRRGRVKLCHSAKPCGKDHEDATVWSVDARYAEKYAASVINQVHLAGGGDVGDCLVLEKKLLPTERISNSPTAKPALKQVSCGLFPLCCSGPKAKVKKRNFPITKSQIW